jgi:Astacin (Peptidase family M12A)
MTMASAFVCPLARIVVAGAVVLGTAATAQGPLNHQSARRSSSQGLVRSRLSGSGGRPESVGVADSGYTWPGGIVYYEIQNGSTNLTTAISTFNADFHGVVQWEDNTTACSPAPTCTATQYVAINLSGTGGQGDVNTIGYPQSPGPVDLNCNTDCSVATILHEMGHIIGLYHEMTRTDSSGYVTVNYSNVIKSTWPYDFQINTQNQQLLTPYDYASVMEYPPYVDTRNGGPVIESIPAGIPMQGAEGVPGAGNQDYSAGDKEAILRLYGHAPTEVTVTSNPVGLQVTVDGTTITTPQTYAWAPNSTHTIGVADGVQTLTGDIENSTTPTTFYYTYGRWSDSTQLNYSTEQTHTITVTPGNGTPAFPTSSPQVATYSANFIQLVPYSETVTPSGSGSVGLSASPALQSCPAPSGECLVAREEATLTATPNAGYNFYEFNNSPFWLPGGLSANPKEFFVPDTGLAVDTTAEFAPTSDSIYTVNVEPVSGDTIANEFSDNLGVVVDNTDFYYAPKNFSPYYDSSWTSGSTHTLNVSSPQSPYSSNSQFSFSSWKEGCSVTGTCTISSLPPASASYSAEMTPQYAPATNFTFAPCGGASTPGTISPSSTEGGFYDWGTALTFTASADTTNGWSFAGWSYDLTGNTLSENLTAEDETLVYANFNPTTNTSGSPLTLTGLSPPSVQAGSGPLTLTLTGTGFDTNSPTTTLVAFDGNYLTPDVVSSTEIQVPVSAPLVATAGTFDVFVESFPTGSSGCADFGYQTFAVTAKTVPTLTWNPATTIIYGSTGTNVLNATANTAGAFTYSATPTGGGSATDITGGTSTLPVGTYNNTVTFTPTDTANYSTAGWTMPLTVSGESVWIVNGAGGTSELAGNGYAITSSADPGANVAVAIDHSGNIWTVGTGSTLLEETSQTGASLKTPTGGGLSSPSAVAIDGNGQVWVTNSSNAISLFMNDGTVVSPSGGIVDPTTLSTPSSIAVDLGGSVWITNKGNNTVTRVLGAAAPAAPLSTAAKKNTTGERP